MSPEDYIVAIPSYRRAETLVSKTLPMLQEHGIARSRIQLWVADLDELTEYKRVLKNARYRLVDFRVGKKGLGNTRNLIQLANPAGVPILEVDDDITEVFELSAIKAPNGAAIQSTRPIEDLHGLIVRGFRLAERKNFRLWGVYPVDNAFFMTGEPTFDLRYICGGFFGIWNTHDPKVYVKLEDKEDFERTLRYYVEDGGVLRFNHVCLMTRGYGGPGGMQVDRTKQRVKASAEWLVKQFPGLAQLNRTRLSGYMELRLKDKRDGLSKGTGDCASPEEAEDSPSSPGW